MRACVCLCMMCVYAILLLLLSLSLSLLLRRRYYCYEHPAYDSNGKELFLQDIHYIQSFSSSLVDTLHTYCLQSTYTRVKYSLRFIDNNGMVCMHVRRLHVYV